MLTPAVYITKPGGWGQDHGVWDRAEIETHLSIEFQNGPVQTRGVNGVQLIDVLRVCRDFARAKNQRTGSSRDRAMVITKIDEAILWEDKRAKYENTREKAAERAAGGPDA